MLPLSIRNEEYKSPRYGMRNGIIVHRMIFIRHGESESNVKSMNGNKEYDVNPPLTDIGLQQANEVKNFLINQNYNPHEIIISPLQRAYLTGKFFIDHLNHHNVSPDIDIMEFNYKKDETFKYEHNNETIHYTTFKENKDNFKRRVMNFFNKMKNEGSVEYPKDTLIITHSQVIDAILSDTFTFHISNASITCIDIDNEGKIHVQAVNYTRHLTTPTGQHSPLV